MKQRSFLTSTDNPFPRSPFGRLNLNWVCYSFRTTTIFKWLAVFEQNVPIFMFIFKTLWKWCCLWKRKLILGYPYQNPFKSQLDSAHETFVNHGSHSNEPHIFSECGSFLFSQLHCLHSLHTQKWFSEDARVVRDPISPSERISG